MYILLCIYIYICRWIMGGVTIYMYIIYIYIPCTDSQWIWNSDLRASLLFLVEFQGSIGSFWINIGLHRPHFHELTGNQKCMKLLVQMSFSSKNIAPDINSPERFGVFEASIKKISRHILDQLIRLGFFSGIKLGHTVSRQFDPRILWNKYPLIVRIT